MSRTPVKTIKTDVLIIGGGVAGLRAAIGASRHGKVMILNKGLKRESSSAFAQGGIAVALSGRQEAMQSHYEDTLQAGHGLCSEKAVKLMIDAGPKRIHELIDWGAAFDKVGDSFAFAREAAHSQNRILRAKGDTTGSEIIKTLQKKIQSIEAISTQNGHFTLDLFVKGSSPTDKTCHGAWVLDEQQGTVQLFLSQIVILATGGGGQVYQRTTNPPVATGDGIAMALRAGARLEDVEFIQFHPTALKLPTTPSFLISETVRGEGGRLRDVEGKPFMDRYHPDAELAPRDLVSRAVWNEIGQSSAQYVFLDITHLEPSFIRERFPKIFETCLHYGIDMTQEQIPVAPSAHYMMGGVKTDLSGKTTIPGLYAVGEVATTGVHGANRLASNSLLEALVYGAHVGEAVEIRPSHDAVEIPDQPSCVNGFTSKELSKKSLEKCKRAQTQLKETMWKHCGIIRSQRSLQKAISQWKESTTLLSSHSTPSRIAQETKNMFWTAAAIIQSALAREESIGAHFRSDFPRQEKKMTTRHIQLTQDTLSEQFQFGCQDVFTE
ncbi:MAG: L-aspartate oxidase [Nitrospiria bacterium]